MENKHGSLFPLLRRIRKDIDSKKNSEDNNLAEIEENKSNAVDNKFLSIKISEQDIEIFNFNLPLKFVELFNQFQEFITSGELSDVKAKYGIDIGQIMKQVVDEKLTIDNNKIIDRYNEDTGIRVEVYIA
ncbi:hypothetical protein [Orenia marismortui]|uniref:hypothetical protein n=1 Tax=Orenia marismortui TaxID=46469 RepID=UPI00035CD00F|nr:hypothetical protein [Orenia marismortui]